MTANLPKSARTEFTSALNQICSERGIKAQDVIASIEIALVAAYKKDNLINENEEEYQYLAEIDDITGEATLYRFTEDKPDKKENITPSDFGRIAAQTAKQVILQQIRETEKSAIIGEYKNKIGTLVNAMVLRFDGKFIICDIGRGQGLMPAEEQSSGERYRLNQRLTLYIKDIRETVKGEQIIVSQADPQLVSKLFEREVPEVSSGAVVIKNIAREPGNRTKIAVASTQAGVDPVGSCVGQKGVRVQAVINELGGEKIDIIEHSDNIKKFIIAALQPAENLELKIDEKKKQATVTVPEDQLSLAIGKEGQNARLAAKLTGYKIDIQGPKKSKTKKSTSDDKKNKKTKKKKKLANDKK